MCDHHWDQKNQSKDQDFPSPGTGAPGTGPGDPAPAGASRGQYNSRVENVSSDRVFNLPLFSIYIVVDCRHRADFDRSHITSAFSFPPPGEGATAESELARLAALVANLADHGPEHFDPIVLCGDGGSSGSAVSSTVAWLAEQLWRVKHARTLALSVPGAGREPNTGLGRGTLDPGADYDYAAAFYQRLVEKNMTVWNIEGGFPDFQARFPFLCDGERTVRDMLPTPTLMHERLYMGSVPLCGSSGLLPLMGLTHLVIDGATKNRLEKDGTLQPGDGRSGTGGSSKKVDATQLIVTLPEQAPPPLEYINAAVAFVSNALSGGGTVLVMVNGRTSSATIIVGWMMKALRMTYSEATAHLQAVAPAYSRGIVPLLPRGVLEACAVGGLALEPPSIV